MMLGCIQSVLLACLAMSVADSLDMDTHKVWCASWQLLPRWCTAS